MVLANPLGAIFAKYGIAEIPFIKAKHGNTHKTHRHQLNSLNAAYTDTAGASIKIVLDNMKNTKIPAGGPTFFKFSKSST